MGLLSDVFSGTSWTSWRAVLRALAALPLSAADLSIYQRVTGRMRAPGSAVREAWFIVGRRGGKSMIAALIAVYQTTCRTYQLAPGERGTFMVIAADRKQARTVKGYVAGLLHAHPSLERLIAKDLDERIELTNGLVIEIHTASFRTLRGYTVIGAVCDEVAFWQSDESANPDTEILAALRPAMATIPDAILVCITSPYARRGEVWKAYQQHYGTDGSPVLVINASSRTMNPDLPQAIVDAAFQDDPAHAAAEYGAEDHVEFRRDVETFVAKEIVDACVMPERYEVPAQPDLKYTAFVDPSGGSSDSMTLAIAHEDRRRTRVVVDVLREVRAPFDPDQVVVEFAATLKPYRVTTVWGDKYAGEWPRERFRARGIQYRTADHTKSELYQALLPRLNARTIDLLDHERLVKQLCALERRTSRGGRDSIDHPPKGHDDVINAVAGVAQYAVHGTTCGIAAIHWQELEHNQRASRVSQDLAACAAADRAREAAGTQDRFLRSQAWVPLATELDRRGRPGMSRMRR
jgi:hypothetical protein